MKLDFPTLHLFLVAVLQYVLAPSVIIRAFGPVSRKSVIRCNRVSCTSRLVTPSFFILFYKQTASGDSVLAAPGCGSRSSALVRLEKFLQLRLLLFPQTKQRRFYARLMARRITGLVSNATGVGPVFLQPWLIWMCVISRTPASLPPNH